MCFAMSIYEAYLYALRMCCIPILAPLSVEDDGAFLFCLLPFSARLSFLALPLNSGVFMDCAEP